MSCCQTLREWLVTSIAFTLGDAETGHEFTRYSLTAVIAALNDALCMVFKHRPDLFTELLIVKLTPGRHQDARGCCNQILDILEQTDSNGNIVKTLAGARRTSTKAKVKWNKPSCVIPKAAPHGYAIDYALTDTTLLGRFEVHPPVPYGLDAYVRIKGTIPPKTYTEDDLDCPVDGTCDIMVAAKFFVLAAMLMGDRFSNAAVNQTAANSYLTTAYNMLGMQQKAEQNLELKNNDVQSTQHKLSTGYMPTLSRGYGTQV